jgi:hypothetical protein
VNLETGREGLRSLGGFWEMEESWRQSVGTEGREPVE